MTNNNIDNNMNNANNNIDNNINNANNMNNFNMNNANNMNTYDVAAHNKKEKKGFANISLVCGILSIILCPFWLNASILLALAIIFSVVSKVNVERPKIAGTWGLVFALLGLVCVIMVISTDCFETRDLLSMEDVIREYRYRMNIPAY